MSNENNLPKQTINPLGFLNLANLTYSQKFTAIALIFALSLLAFLPLVVDQNNRIENYGRKELQGSVYLRFVWQFTADLQSLYVVSIERENGNESDFAVNEAIIRVEADLIAFESASQQYAITLGVNPYLQEIKNEWIGLRSAIEEHRMADAEASFVKLNNIIKSLITEIGNKSYLILDPDIDTYYLMDTVLLNMPENNDLIFRVWQIANEATESGEISREKQFELRTLVDRLQANLQKLDQNMQASIENNQTGEIEDRTSVSIQNYLSATQSFINVINTYFTFTDEENIQFLNRLVLEASYSSVNRANQVLYLSASEALENGIQSRIQSMSFRLYSSIMLAAFSTLLAFIVGLRIMRTISLPLTELLSATQKLKAGDMSTRVLSPSKDEAGQVAQAFNALAEELQVNRLSLQSRADELERRTTELETIAEVARDISIIRDLNTMLNVATSLIHEKFGFYHVGIYLVDERSEYAILRAASGQSVQALIEQNYKTRVGTTGIVGNVSQTGQAQIASFTNDSFSSSKNSLLPGTKSEIGLPLRGKSLTIGILNIHSTIENAFSKREVQIFQILADQLAAAIDNAQLIEQVEAAIAEVNATNRVQTRRNWEAKNMQESLSYEYDGLRIQAVPKNLPATLLNQLENGKPIVIQQEDSETFNGNLSENSLIVPLMLSGQLIGVIGLERAGSNSNWTDEEISIAEAAANRTAIALENARLLEESQRRAVKERTISEATARISTALSVENILGIAAEELERVIGDSEVILQIKADDKSALN